MLAKERINQDCLSVKKSPAALYMDKSKKQYEKDLLNKSCTTVTDEETIRPRNSRIRREMHIL